MLNKLKKEYKRFIERQFKKNNKEYENLLKECEKTSNMLDLSYDFLFVENWRNFYFENKDLINKKFEKLNANLDSHSINTAKQIWERFIYLMPFQKYIRPNSLYVDRNKFFDEEEIEDQIKFNNMASAFGQNYKLSYDIYEVSVFGYHHGLKLLPAEVLALLKGKDFMDIGAFVGDSALILNEYEPDDIHCFEPSSTNYELLKKTIEMNHLSNIKIYNIGLGDKECEIDFNDNFNSASFHIETSINQNLKKMKISTVDEVCRYNDLNLGLIKLDVEGYELECIKGALESIKKHRPVLLISVYHHPKDFFEIKPLLESLNLGYKFMIRKTNPFSLTYETMLLAYI